MTVYFMCPDLTNPVGGVKVIYGACRALNERGIESMVWHSDAKNLEWATSLSAPVAEGSHLALSPGDMLIVPETSPFAMGQVNAHVPTVVFNQNHYYTYEDASTDADLSGNCPLFGNVRGVIATSEAIVDFLDAQRITVPVHRVPLYVPTEFLEPGPSLPERRRVITFMPRKRTNELLALLASVKRDPEFAAWEYRPLQNLSSEGVGEELRRSTVFLHGGQQEGFGLPGIEAMAAGAYLVGFAGGGGKEFMQDEFCTVLPEDDLVTAIHGFKSALRAFERNPEGLSTRAEAARRHVVERYTWEGFTDAFVRAIHDLGAEGAAVDTPQTAHHSTHYLHTQRLRTPKPKRNLRMRLGEARDALFR